MKYLPTTRTELDELAWDTPDIIIVSGDAYVDHPSFAAAIIGRNLAAAGYKVAILDQPDWSSEKDIMRLGRPKLFFGVTAGNMDSMVNHYTAQRKLRHNDAYTPGGVHGKRPDRATIMYTNLIRRAYKGVPVIIGGVEASLRRIAHYDYWSDRVRNSILPDSKADILVYGMGERPILQIAARIAAGEDLKTITDVEGTVVYCKDIPAKSICLPDAEACRDTQVFHEMNQLFYKNFQTAPLYQASGGRIIKHNPPSPPLSEAEIDRCYNLPFTGLPHPKYGDAGIPAYEQIRCSITSHRGCYGGCNFCAIALHQGREIQSRSEESILNEVSSIANSHDFSGTITDVGGPTANMYGTSCKLGFPKSCARKSCLYPSICSNLITDHRRHIKLLEKVASLKRVRHLFVSSGIRHDLAAGDSKYIALVAAKYTGGRLKLAPEHVVSRVLALMGKPSIQTYERFVEVFEGEVKRQNLKRQVVPYIIIGHPGTTLDDAIELGIWLKKNNIKLEQVQEFTPTPMTISTCMYYTGLDFKTGKPLEVPKGHEIRIQKALVFWYERKYHRLILEALKKARREDLISFFIDR